MTPFIRLSAGVLCTLRLKGDFASQSVPLSLSILLFGRLPFCGFEERGFRKHNQVFTTNNFDPAGKRSFLCRPGLFGTSKR